MTRRNETINYNIPTIEGYLPRLSKAKVFMVCDVKDGFCHSQLDAESSKLTTFTTPQGPYCWERLSFGITAAPELFQRKLDKAIKGLLCVSRIVDDFLSWDEESTLGDARQRHDVHMEAFHQPSRHRAEVGQTQLHTTWPKWNM